MRIEAGTDAKNDEAPRTNDETITKPQKKWSSSRAIRISLVIRHFGFIANSGFLENRQTCHSSVSAGGGCVADFKSLPSSFSWSRGLTGMARRISTGFLSSGWTGIAFLISGADS